MKSFLVALLSYSLLASPCFATEGVMAPSGIFPQSDAEYYATSAFNKVLIPIHVWGSVKEPGVHYIPFGSSLTNALSSAGGPLPYNSADVLLIHANGRKETLNMYDEGFRRKLQSNDTIQVNINAVQANLPLIVSAITAIALLIGVGIALSHH